MLGWDKILSNQVGFAVMFFSKNSVFLEESYLKEPS